MVAEAARLLKPGGRLIIVDLAPHEIEVLRERHAHRRLGFSDAEVGGWLAQAGLTLDPPVKIPGGTLTVVLWLAHKKETRS